MKMNVVRLIMFLIIAVFAALSAFLQYKLGFESVETMLDIVDDQEVWEFIYQVSMWLNLASLLCAMLLIFTPIVCWLYRVACRVINWKDGDRMEKVVVLPISKVLRVKV